MSLFDSNIFLKEYVEDFGDYAVRYVDKHGTNKGVSKAWFKDHPLKATMNFGAKVTAMTYAAANAGILGGLGGFMIADDVLDNRNKYKRNLKKLLGMKLNDKEKEVENMRKQQNWKTVYYLGRGPYSIKLPI